jgi:hypothetical protein
MRILSLYVPSRMGQLEMQSSKKVSLSSLTKLIEWWKNRAYMHLSHFSHFADTLSRRVLELSNTLLDVIMETNAWASARPKHEATMESQKLEEQISHIMTTEREQGMSSPAHSSSSSFFRVRFVGMPHSVMASLTNFRCYNVDSDHSFVLRSWSLDIPLLIFLYFGTITEQTRERLGEFVRRMKTALAALAGSPF